MRARLVGEITGPISMPSSSAVADLARRGRVADERRERLARLRPTVMTTDDARQRWPAQPNAESATMRVVISMSASGRMTIGFLAPPWHCARLPLAAARL